MPTRQEIRDAIRDFQNFDRSALTPGQRTVADTALGLFYEAYAQSVLRDRHIDADVSAICGFVKYVSVIPINVSSSTRAPRRPAEPASPSKTQAA